MIKTIPLLLSIHKCLKCSLWKTWIGHKEESHQQAYVQHPVGFPFPFISASPCLNFIFPSYT